MSNIRSCHIVELNFISIIKIWRPLYRKFGKKIWLPTLWNFKSTSLESCQVLFRSVWTGSLDFIRFYIPARHFSEHYFCPMIRIRKQLSLNFRKKLAVNAIDYQKYFLVVSFRTIFEPF